MKQRIQKFYLLSCTFNISQTTTLFLHHFQTWHKIVVSMYYCLSTALHSDHVLFLSSLEHLKLFIYSILLCFHTSQKNVMWILLVPINRLTLFIVEYIPTLIIDQFIHQKLQIFLNYFLSSLYFILFKLFHCLTNFLILFLNS